MCKSKPKDFDLLVIGHLTKDLINGKTILGGAASFAAKAASILGYRVNLLTTASQSPLLDSLNKDPNIFLSRQPSSEMTTFSLDYSKEVREIFLECRVSDIDFSTKLDHSCPVFLAPVIGEISPKALELFKENFLILGLQGWMRKVDESGFVLQGGLPEFPSMDVVDVIVFSELDCPNPDALAKYLVSKGAKTVAVTRGDKGITLFTKEQTLDLSAFPVKKEVDSTGAGDVFAVTFALSLYGGDDLIEAALQGMWVASKVVEGPGMGLLTPENFKCDNSVFNLENKLFPAHGVEIKTDALPLDNKVAFMGMESLGKSSYEFGSPS